MNISFSSLTLECRKSKEVINFSSQITYIHGQISAGKSSIMRLIDYCLGGSLEKTPAISQELVSASLLANINKYQVLFERDTSSGNRVQVSWRDHDGNSATVLAPIKADKKPIWKDDVFNLSDLFFYLAGITPLKVKKSKLDESSNLVRLSIRDMMWYCYLDQDNLDSSFYRLEDTYRKLKSRDVMRFVTGLYTSRMSELEIELDEVRNQQRAKRTSAKQIRKFLDEYGYGSELEIVGRMQEAESELTKLKLDRQSLQQNKVKTHVSDSLREELRKLGNTLTKERETLINLEERISEQEKLKAELISSKFKLAKAKTASNILTDVKYEVCPSCGTHLKETSTSDTCYLCKSPTEIKEDGDIASQAHVINKDLNSRIDDLSESIRRHKKAKKLQKVKTQKLETQKEDLDIQLNEELANYDSAFLARSQEINRRIATLTERINGLKQLIKIPEAIENLLVEANELGNRINEIENAIEHEKSKLVGAEQNIKDIERIYLDILVRVGVPGISEKDKIIINRTTWIPSILLPDGDSYDFYNAGSGGKKTLLNTCYALAVHQVANESNLPLPKFLMIDTPMKNIGEDVNKDIFEAFYKLLYKLSTNELAGVQFIIIDKEFLPHPSNVDVDIENKFMDPENNPLISYYRGA